MGELCDLVCIAGTSAIGMLTLKTNGFHVWQVQFVEVLYGSSMKALHNSVKFTHNADSRRL